MGTKDILLEVAAVSRRWISLPKRTMTDQLTPVDKKVRLPLGTVLVLGTALAACARISSELPNPTNPVVDNGPRSGEVTPIYDGLSYNKNVGVLGVGIDGFDPIPQTQKLSELALVALKFPQGEPNSQVLVSKDLSKVLPGLDEAMVARDKDGVEKSGLLSINNNLFVLTRVGEGSNNSLAIFAPNYASIRHNPDGSASMNAYMTTRDGQGKWRIEQNIMISITLVFDANGKLISYVVPVLNPTFEPTREPDQRADVIVPKNISFRVAELKAPEPTSTIPATSTSTPTIAPTWTPAPTYTQARPLPTAVVGPSAIPKPEVNISPNDYTKVTPELRSIVDKWVNSPLGQGVDVTDTRNINNYVNVISYGGPTPAILERGLIYRYCGPGSCNSPRINKISDVQNIEKVVYSYDPSRGLAKITVWPK